MSAKELILLKPRQGSQSHNIGRIRLLRLQADGRDWELKLDPPVNKVLSIARDRLAGLRTVLGELGGS